ncbi:hypothetical protein [Bathymodiolus septemdierum thioautotrophic gill symbiont]|uniref:Lipoprotein n=1 Tax=endosymbiont of Bathymodiolus septemdierum str. Myojin knoll TaxID=1303921 RepID=A0A0P0UTN8_9GAMM|nr:hypothetical protein [Bathymodiolus septemdierum thioautotrophic gill symbiont]BAS68333.1 lipoprotein [endosymbiont of Bathymodiolus septemdierum str. Myojin knoll]
MEFNLFGKISIVMVSLALLVGCGSKPVKNIDNSTISGVSSISSVENAIIRAGAGLGWIIKKKNSGHMVGKLALRKHVAIVDITYTKNSYSIKYKDSTNLNYDGTNIHSNYNGWIQNLQNAINVQLNLQ